MNAFTLWTQSHRRSILFMVVVLALAGAVVSFKLPVALFPNVDFPRVVVSLDAGNRAAELMELQVTRPVEEAVGTVLGVEDVRSITSRAFCGETRKYLASALASISTPYPGGCRRPESYCRPTPAWPPSPFSRRGP